MACSFKESCRGNPSVCVTCAGLWDRPVCSACWQEEFAGGCFRCKGAIAYTSPQSSSHKFRYCDACYIYTFADVAEGDEVQKCYYCNTISETVATTKCSYFVECPGHVRVCSWCVQVRQSVACSACYLRNWGRSCYSCNKASQLGEYGKYCRACFQLVTETGRRQVLAEEAAAYFRKLAIPVEITGDEPALQFLVLPIHDGPELAPYSDEPVYLSPEHCRICLADCSQEVVSAGDDGDLFAPAASAAAFVSTAMGVERGSAECTLPLHSRDSAAEVALSEMGVDRGDAECLSPLRSRGFAFGKDIEEVGAAANFAESDLIPDHGNLSASGSQGRCDGNDIEEVVSGGKVAKPRSSLHSNGQHHEQHGHGQTRPRQRNVVTGVSPRVAKHVLEHHGLQPQEYRQHVRGRDMASGPQRVTAQVVRSRLAAWKQELNDEAFAEIVCNCCAQSCSRKSVQRVEFPCRAAEIPPVWLGWSPEQWEWFRDSWYDQIHAVFDVEQALQKQFHADERVREAEAAVLLYGEGASASNGENPERTLVVREAFANRVRNWRDFTRDALRADGVPAPSDPSARWMLFKGEASGLTCRSDGSIELNLCVHCAKQLKKVDSKGKPAVGMPLQALANGLWLGPEPEEIRMLTWTERRVLRLARVYCCVKRVLEKEVPWARGKPEVLPQYSTRNVIAFLQNPDGAVRTLCLLPQDLCQDLYIQFEGGDPSHVLREPAVQVDIQRLRRGIWWYATHCYQWIEATREHELFAFDRLGAQLEHVLEAYRQSLSGKTTGVPSTVTEIATPIAPDQLFLQQRGPADADAGNTCGSGSSGGSESENSTPSSSVNKRKKKRIRQPHDSSMAVASTGHDEMDTLSLWSRAMEKYAVLNQLKEQYDNAELVSDEGAKQAAVREETHCLGEAVHALRALASSETRKALSRFHEHMQGVCF